LKVPEAKCPEETAAMLLESAQNLLNITCAKSHLKVLEAT